MIVVGKKQVLKVDREDSSGFYLLCAENLEVFMPGTLAPAELKKGDDAEVFVFIDSTGEEIATGSMPLAEVGEFACLLVKDVAPQGAYLDIGLPKDLLVPKKFQKYEMKKGEVHLVRVMKEDENNRLYGTSKIGKFIESENIKLEKLQTVALIPFHRTPLGFKVLVDKKYVGMIYHNEIFSEIERGKEYEGSVKAVRPDGQVDAVIGRIGLTAVKNNSDLLLDALNAAGGKLNLWDKSSPEEIKETLSMSKKAFKAAVGVLYKKRLIKINDGSIELV